MDTEVRPRIGNCMQTFTGRAYWPADPRAEDVSIEDIAHHLSMLCRYTGAVEQFYSVAEHSVHVSRMVPEVDALQGLLHDATEAYVNDLARPVKRMLPEYNRIEDLNRIAIADAFGLEWAIPKSVHAADDSILLVEKAALMKESPLPWGEGLPVLPRDQWPQIHGMLPYMAEAHFLRRFHELTWRRK